MNGTTESIDMDPPSLSSDDPEDNSCAPTDQEVVMMSPPKHQNRVHIHRSCCSKVVWTVSVVAIRLQCSLT